MSKKYKFKGEVTNRIITALEKEGADESQLYVNSEGMIVIQVERDESEFHPDDKGAARVFYQSTGIEA